MVLLGLEFLAVLLLWFLQALVVLEVPVEMHQLGLEVRLVILLEVRQLLQVQVWYLQDP